MAFDFKKEFKEFYLPATKPAIIEMPAMNYLAVRGKGNPNEEGGAYKRALEQLYGIAYTLKMSYKSSYRIEGFFEYKCRSFDCVEFRYGLYCCILGL